MGYGLVGLGYRVYCRCDWLIGDGLTGWVDGIGYRVDRVWDAREYGVLGVIAVGLAQYRCY